MSALANRYGEVQDRITAACASAGRDREGITLVVVTKFHPVDLVENLYQLGHRDFGENRDQEAAPKAAALAQLLAARPESNGANWHFVGQLQSNKVKSVISYASTIHSLDRDSLLQSLASQTLKRAQQAQLEGLSAPKPIDVFIELNLTSDAARGGIQPTEVSEFAHSVLQVEGLNLLGVMGVAGLGVEPSYDFERIAKVSQILQTIKPEAKFISAGMSADFESAINFGATHLRVGTAITGERQ